MRALSSLVALAALAAAGCAVNPYAPNASFGAAVTGAKAMQVVNTGPVRPVSATGLDGVAAKAAMDRYHKSFEEPPVPQNVLNIGVGQAATTTR